MRVLKNFSPGQVLTVLIVLAMFGLASNAGAYNSIKSRKNGVTVDVKPLQFVTGKPARFQVRMNTHSVNLGEDMVAVSLLRDDQGREYRPLRWDGSPPGGHHRNGVLEFPNLEGNIKSFTLLIRNIAGVPERTFEWKMEQ